MGRPGTFRKGEDPRRNLNGRGKKKSLTAHLEEALTDDARKKVAIKIVAAMKAGDLRAIEFAYDRIDGKVPQKIDIAGMVGELAREAGLSEADTELAVAEASRITGLHE